MGTQSSGDHPGWNNVVSRMTLLTNVVAFFICCLASVAWALPADIDSDQKIEEYDRFGKRADADYVRFGKRADADYVRFGKRALANSFFFPRLNQQIGGKRSPDSAYVRFGKRSNLKGITPYSGLISLSECSRYRDYAAGSLEDLIFLLEEEKECLLSKL